MSRNKSSYRDLQVWRRSHDLSLAVYRVTSSFPDEEKFGLTSQMRRAATSVPANIAEGCARHSRKEFRRYLHIAAGSLAELDTFLDISEALGLVREEEVEVVAAEMDEIGKMLYGLIRSLHASRS